jgi:hypothetical protein
MSEGSDLNASKYCPKENSERKTSEADAANARWMNKLPGVWSLLRE